MSYPDNRVMKRVVVTGGAHGLGRAIVDALDMSSDVTSIVNIDNSLAVTAGHEPSRKKVRNLKFDLSSGEDGFRGLGSLVGDVDVLINCAGVNWLEWIKDLDTDDWDRAMNVNARAPWLLTKSLLPALSRSNGTVLNVVSNAAHTPMTASLAYNASKAAAHMVTLQMAHELTKRNGITVFGIAPAKIRGTVMSTYIEEEVQTKRGWTPEYAEQYQRDGLVTGEEIEPQVLAELIVWLVADKLRHFHFSGCVIPYGL